MIVNTYRLPASRRNFVSTHPLVRARRAGNVSKSGEQGVTALTLSRLRLWAVASQLLCWSPRYKAVHPSTLTSQYDYNIIV